MPADRNHSRQRQRREDGSIQRRWPDTNPDAPLATLTPLLSTLVNGHDVRVDTVVQIATASGPRLALVRRVFDVQGLAWWSTQLHIHFLTRSFDWPDLFLCPPNDGCTNVDVAAVSRVLDGPHEISYVALADGWRDRLPAGAGPHHPGPGGDPFPHTACDACLSGERTRENTARVIYDLDGKVCLRVEGREYHPGDLVMVRREGNVVWTPAVLTGRHEAQRWCLRLCGRFGDLPNASGRFIDDNRLYLKETTEWVPLSAITAASGFTCTELLPRGGQASRRSLVPLPHGRYSAPNITPADVIDLDEPRPNVTELYAGGGGSLRGFARHCSVRHAVEVDEDACATLRANFPSLRVHQTTVEAWSRRQRRWDLRPVDLLVAGPPCQGVTLANHHRAADDTRNGELGVTLRTIQRVKPTLVVLENVPGIASSFSNGPLPQINLLAQTARALLKSGYQVRLGYLSSRAYGSPQNRKRIFVLAARRGIPLPSFPEPTHANPSPSTIRLRVGGREMVLGSKDGGGPRPAVTARDAVGDMPFWDYSSQGLRVRRTSIGVHDGTGYRSLRNAYQRRARGQAQGVVDHKTPRPTGVNMEYILAAPGADEDAPGPGNELRCDPNGAVPTIQSNPWPGGKATRNIHWSHHRVFSVAERRRFVGLPDAHVLEGSVNTKNRLLGNMVDVNVASAIAAQIKREVFSAAWEEWGRPEPADFWRRWRALHPA